MYVFNEIRTNIAQICAILYVHMYIFIVNMYILILLLMACHTSRPINWSLIMDPNLPPMNFHVS